MSIRHFAPPGFAIIPATLDDHRYMLLNCHIGLWSKHLANKLGATIVDAAGHILSLGFNGHREGIEDGDPANWTKPERFIHSVHAEDNALLNAQINNVSVRGATMHILRFPCSEKNGCAKDGCSQKIIAAGIGCVVVYSPPEDANHRLTENFCQSLHLLINAGVAIRWHDPADAVYYPHMIPKPDTRPVPSGSVDWPARFLDLACYIAGWQPNGVGEVIVRRSDASGMAQRTGKIVRALGCHGTFPAKGAIETAAAIGVPIADCTLYMSAPPDKNRQAVIGTAGIRQIVLPDSPAHKEWLSEKMSLLNRQNLSFSLMKPDLQAAPPDNAPMQR